MRIYMHRSLLRILSKIFQCQFAIYPRSQLTASIEKIVKHIVRICASPVMNYAQSFRSTGFLWRSAFTSQYFFYSRQRRGVLRKMFVITAALSVGERLLEIVAYWTEAKFAKLLSPICGK